MKYIRYLIVGGTAFLLDFLVFCAIYYTVPADRVYLKKEEFANAAAMLSGFIYSFVMHRRWTFASNAAPYRQFLLCGAVLIFNIIMSNFVIGYLTNHYRIEEYILKLAVQIIIVVWNYAIYDKLIFRNTN